MAGVERVDRGPAYDIFEEPETPRLPEQEKPALPKPAQKALPEPVEAEEETDSDLYVNTIDEIMSIYDADATAAEAAEAAPASPSNTSETGSPPPTAVAAASTK